MLCRVLLLTIFTILCTSCNAGTDASVEDGQQQSSPSAAAPLPDDPQEGWKMYQDSRFWFSFQYPPVYTIEAPPKDAKRKPLPAVQLKGADGRPVPLQTVKAHSSTGMDFALHVYRGVPEGTSIADLTYDERCGTPVPDVILSHQVFVAYGIRFVEKMQKIGDRIDIDYCFLNRQRYVLSLHAWNVPQERAEHMENLLKQILATITLHRSDPTL